MKIICFGSAIIFSIGYATFATGSFWLVAANIVPLGAILTPMLPVCIAFAGEITFP